MNTDSVRLNITLPRELAEELDEFSGTRKRSRFIAEALRQRIKQMEREELEKNMEEGYRATEQEGRALAKEFETADLEGWDEY